MTKAAKRGTPCGVWAHAADGLQIGGANEKDRSRKFSNEFEPEPFQVCVSSREEDGVSPSTRLNERVQAKEQKKSEEEAEPKAHRSDVRIAIVASI